MKITAWCIVRERHLSDAFTGLGASYYPGRWNKRGTPVIYTAGTLSLAAMEMLVHLGTADVLNPYISIPISFGDALCRQLIQSDLPKNWTADPAPESTRALGSKWIEDCSSAVLAVPSVIVPIETVFILNPQHPDFSKINIGDASEFKFDSRLKN